ncbi:MBL fold metallo-hydrolase [Gemella cuniculi]|uniref:MBL fold metallo-hydrolase n=1 Tax=Gemella cuniculi TaxID=150240 RepID=UPI0004210A38|nr:MBL fold metallo-hydrolase [Gemella cuniculi]
MKKILKIYKIPIFILVTCLTFFLANTSDISAKDRLHIITVAEYSDAIILESDGHFAMIDTGEDFSFPDGSNPKYPFRDGITTDSKKVTEDRLLAHIKKLGIKKFDFVLITHTHSDHIGAAHDILKSIPTDKLYLKKYSDDRISDKNRLWDNLYGYDRALAAAKEKGVKIIQNITKQDSFIKLGNITINLLNYENEYDKHGNLSKVYDENLNSILAILNIKNTKIFLGGDLENTELKKEDYFAPLIGKVDVMKFNHHMETTKSNTKNFVNTLNPKYMIKTGINRIEENYKKYLDEKNVNIINAGRRDIAAIVLDFDSGKVIDVSKEFPHYGFYYENNTLKFKDWNGNYPPEGWVQHDDNWYYFKNNGEVTVKWEKIDNNWFLFSDDGKLKDGLVEDNNNFYYIDKNKGMLSKTWKEHNSKNIYLKSNGQMAKDEWENWYHFEKDGTISKNKWIGLLYINDKGQYNPFNFRNIPLFLLTLIVTIIVVKKVLKNHYNRTY